MVQPARHGEIVRRRRELDDMVTDLSGLTGEFTSLLTQSLADGVLEPGEHGGETGNYGK